MFFSQTAPRDDEYYEGDVTERDPDGGTSSFFHALGSLPKNLTTMVCFVGQEPAHPITLLI
jgi:hypothetical protein